MPGGTSDSLDREGREFFVVCYKTVKIIDDAPVRLIEIAYLHHAGFVSGRCLYHNVYFNACFDRKV